MANLRDGVVVVTGASSGLGRATALEFAARGSRLVLAARRLDDLETLVVECQCAGGDAIAVETDVTIDDDVVRLAAAAVDQFGRIDVWINNAGVTYYSFLEDGPFEPHRRVIETNLFGAMFGARAAVRVFRAQRRGVLINVGSVLSEVGHAFVPSYAISKAGLKGLSEALRVEVADQPDIHVCSIFPYAMDTPHFEVAKNEVGRRPYPMPPLQSPEKVARAIARLAERPRRVRHVPRIAVLGLALHAIAPRTTEWLLLAALRRWHLDDRPPLAAGNLYVPPPEHGAIHGTRQPRLSTAHLVGWLIGQLARLQLQRARRLLARAA